MSLARFAVHELGDYQRSRDGLSVSRGDPKVTEYHSLDGMHPFERKTFEWMLEIGEVCTSCGSTVYQIRKEQK